MGIETPADPEVDRVEGQIRAINPYAKVHRTERCAIPLDQVLDRNAFDLSRILDVEPDFLEEGLPPAAERQGRIALRSKVKALLLQMAR